MGELALREAVCGGSHQRNAASAGIRSAHQSAPDDPPRGDACDDRCENEGEIRADQLGDDRFGDRRRTSGHRDRCPGARPDETGEYAADETKVPVAVKAHEGEDSEHDEHDEDRPEEEVENLAESREVAAEEQEGDGGEGDQGDGERGDDRARESSEERLARARVGHGSRPYWIPAMDGLSRPGGCAPEVSTRSLALATEPAESCSSSRAPRARVET